MSIKFKSQFLSDIKITSELILKDWNPKKSKISKIIKNGLFNFFNLIFLSNILLFHFEEVKY